MRFVPRLLVLAFLPLSACVVKEERPHPHTPVTNSAPAPVTPATTATPATPASPASGQHPEYLHALSDLRNARANLEKKGGDGTMRWDEHVAIEHIDRAINEIKKAAIDDGKPLEDHPPVDAKEPRNGRLHKALAALRQARADVMKEEDNASVRGLRNRSIEAIDAAIHATDEGIAEAAKTS